MAASVINENVLLVPERLAHLLPNASHINKELVATAKDVGLNNFSETMRLVEQQLAATMPEEFLEMAGPRLACRRQVAVTPCRAGRRA